MTVKEIMNELSKFPEDMIVITAYHSDYDRVSDIVSFNGIEQGGYISRAWPHNSKVRCQEFVRII